MKDGDMPALSRSTQAQTLREWAEYFLRSSAEVEGRTFFTALRRSVAILLPVMYSSVVSRLDMYRTKLLMYRTMVLLAHPPKVRR